MDSVRNYQGTNMDLVRTYKGKNDLVRNYQGANIGMFWFACVRSAWGHPMCALHAKGVSARAFDKLTGLRQAFDKLKVLLGSSWQVGGAFEAFDQLEVPSTSLWQVESAFNKPLAS